MEQAESGRRDYFALRSLHEVESRHMKFRNTDRLGSTLPDLSNRFGLTFFLYKRSAVLSIEARIHN